MYVSGISSNIKRRNGSRRLKHRGGFSTSDNRDARDRSCCAIWEASMALLTQSTNNLPLNTLPRERGDHEPTGILRLRESDIAD